MPRNKYPEQTVEKILDVAFRLFMEQGYDQTTIQDIIDNLGGLTKGAIYHHFKNKEEILLAAGDRIYGANRAYYEQLLKRTDKNGLEKIRELVQTSLDAQGEKDVMAVAPDLKKSPKIFVNLFDETMKETAPFLQQLIEEGVADGSIETKQPRQLAEVFLLMTNLWMNPLAMPTTEADLTARFWFFRDCMEQMGLKGILDERQLEYLQGYRENYNKVNHK